MVMKIDFSLKARVLGTSSRSTQTFFALFSPQLLLHQSQTALLNLLRWFHTDSEGRAIEGYEEESWGVFDLHHHSQFAYSYFRESTGFDRAVFRDWTMTVKKTKLSAASVVTKKRK